MHAVDTNVIVRLFAHDDAEQATAARRVLGHDTIFIPKSVILEFEWVMRGVYRETRVAIAAAIETMLATANVEVEDAAAVERAVRWFRQGLDLADAVHLASSAHAGRFFTFDTAMRRRAKALGIEPEAVSP